jgi:hypothetical protein
MLKNFFHKYLSMNQRENRFRVSHGLEQVKLGSTTLGQLGWGGERTGPGGGGANGSKRI